MSIAVAILLMAAGAILYFATDLRVSGFDLDAIGVILMVAGAVGLIVTMALWGRARRPAATSADDTLVLPTEAPVAPAAPVAPVHVHQEQPPVRDYDRRA